MLTDEISEDIKSMIRSRKYTKEEVLRNIYKKYGHVEKPLSLGFWYDCCYASVCEGMGIDRKNGEKLKMKRKLSYKKRG